MKMATDKNVRPFGNFALALLFFGVLVPFVLAGCSPQTFTPSRKLEIRLINQESDGTQYYAYLVINQFFDASSEKPVEVVISPKKDHAQAILVCNHLETGSKGLSQNLKVFQIQLLEPQKLHLTRDQFSWLPADYTLPDLAITRLSNSGRSG